MRRGEKAISEREAIEGILERGRVLYLGLADGSQPYVVPLHYGFRAGRIYCHSAPQGRKIEILRRNPLISFTVVENMEIVPAATPCDWSTRYDCVCGEGVARILDDFDERLNAMNVIMAQFGGETIPRTVDHPGVALIEISIERLSGKRSG